MPGTLGFESAFDKTFRVSLKANSAPSFYCPQTSPEITYIGRGAFVSNFIRTHLPLLAVLDI